MGQNIGYARVSTREQDLTLQLEALSAEGCERIFHGKQSGRGAENERMLDELVNYVREGDVVITTKLDRLGRSLKSTLNTIDRIHEKGALLRTLDRAIDTSNDSPFAKAMVSLLGTFAQLERDLIVSRTTEGREAAKIKGVTFGRKSSLSEDQKKQVRSLLDSGSTVSAVAKQFGVGRPTIYRAKKSKQI